MRNLKIFSRILAMLFMAGFLISCSTMPETFTVGEPGWTDINVSKHLNRSSLLRKVTEVIVRESYDPELISNDTGYLRTKWYYTVRKVSGFAALFSRQKSRQDYRTRIVIQASEDAKRLSVKCEAEYLQDSGIWLKGFDTARLNDVSQAIRGTIGGY